MTHIQKSRRGGFTIVELMVAVAVLSILVTLAVPTVRNVIANSYANGISNEFVAALNYARSEAVKRRSAITICSSANGSSCRADGDANNWHRGWIVLNGATVLRSSGQLDGGAQITGPSTVVYASTGTATANTFQIRLANCTSNNNRDVSIGVTGRVGVTKVAC